MARFPAALGRLHRCGGREKHRPPTGCQRI